MEALGKNCGSLYRRFCDSVQLRHGRIHIALHGRHPVQRDHPRRRALGRRFPVAVVLVSDRRHRSGWSASLRNTHWQAAVHEELAMKRKAAVVFFCIAAAAAQGQPETESAYSEVFYPSANLRIQAYLYKPDGDGPFPVVIYNHGSRDGRERASVPFQYVGKMLTRAGYAVLVPERRGYGKCAGSTREVKAANALDSVFSR